MGSLASSLALLLLVLRDRGMSRDPRRLRVFMAADALVVDVYEATRRFPVEERFGLQAQLRRAAVSTAVNIVEGSARRTTREYLQFLNIAAGSAAETSYLAELAHRLGLLSGEACTHLSNRYTDVLKGLLTLIRSLESPKPKA